MNKSTIIIAFLAGILVGILAWNIVNINVTPVYADGQSTTNGYIAVTGMMNNNTDCLWVLDTRDTEKSPSLCMYVPNSSGRGLKLAGARRIKYDSQVLEMHDETEKDYKISTLKTKLKELEEEAERKRLQEEKDKAKKEARQNKNTRP